MSSTDLGTDKTPSTPGPPDIPCDLLDISILSELQEAEDLFVNRLSEPVRTARDKFLTSWEALANFERTLNDKSVSSSIADPVLTRTEQSRKKRTLFLTFTVILKFTLINGLKTN
jgi:hypothetical protein